MGSYIRTYPQFLLHLLDYMFIYVLTLFNVSCLSKVHLSCLSNVNLFTDMDSTYQTSYLPSLDIILVSNQKSSYWTSNQVKKTRFTRTMKLSSRKSPKLRTTPPIPAIFTPSTIKFRWKKKRTSKSFHKKRRYSRQS